MMERHQKANLQQTKRFEQGERCLKVINLLVAAGQHVERLPADEWQTETGTMIMRAIKNMQAMQKYLSGGNSTLFSEISEFDIQESGLRMEGEHLTIGRQEAQEGRLITD